MRLFLPTALLLASVAPGLPTAHAVAVPDATIFLLPGESAAGVPSGVIFDQLISYPTLNNDGKVAFHAILEGEGIGFENRGGIWANEYGSSTLLARAGSHAPGLPDNAVFLNFIDTILLNSSGDVAFFGYLPGETRERHSIWSGGREEEIALIAMDDQQAPGLPSGVSLFGFNSLSLNSAGQIAFSSGLRGVGVNESNDEAIWSRKGEAWAAVARTGEQAPSLPVGVRFAYFGIFDGSASNVSFNSLGQTAFVAGITGDGVDQSNNSSIWSEATGSLAIIARSGDQAPGAFSGIKFAKFGSPALNSQGDTVFTASLTGDEVNKTISEGIWVARKNALALVARTGDAAPGVSGSVTFAGLGESVDTSSNPVINSTGDIAFRAILAGDPIGDENNTSIWSTSSGVPTMLVQEGDQAPGLPDGVVFSGFDPPVLNDAGQVAFRGFIAGEGIDSFNDIGVWAQDRDGDLRLIARAGDVLETSPGQFLKIGAPSFAASFTGQTGASSFNDRGQLAICAGGIGFISNRVALPEPPRGVFVAIASVLFCKFTTSRRELGTRCRRQ